MAQESFAKIVDESTVELLEAVEKFPVEKALDSIHDLEGAYVLALMLWKAGKVKDQSLWLIQSDCYPKDDSHFLLDSNTLQA